MLDPSGSGETTPDPVHQGYGRTEAVFLRECLHQLLPPSPSREVGATQRCFVQGGRAGGVPGVGSFGNVLFELLRGGGPVDDRPLREAHYPKEVPLNEPQYLQGTG